MGLSATAVKDNRGVSAAILRTHPAKAAVRLLGATIESRGVLAVIVEVEAYEVYPMGRGPIPPHTRSAGRRLATG